MTDNTNYINELIKTHNPFAGHNVVKSAQIWGKSFPDAPSINAQASNAVFDAVAKVSRRERQTIGITIAAEKGVGKSHIISRIRHRLQAEDGALFIYMSKYDNLNKIKYQFLEIIASSLRAFGSHEGVMQWQEIAGALINDAKQWNYTPQQYVKQFPSWLSKSSNKNVDNLTDLVLQSKPNINNPYIVKAILWTLSPTHATYATHWLSGWELTENKAAAMLLPNPKREEREAEALTTVRQILDITSNYKVPVICFDELDITDLDDNGYPAAHVVANLAKDLYNSLDRAVLLLAMYAQTWRNKIRGMSEADAVIDRLVSEQPDRQPIALKNLNSDDVVAIVWQWLKEFYEKHQQLPPHPLYPFNENQLRELGKEKPTVRDVLKWCAENFVPVDVKEKKHPVQPYFDAELENLQDVDILDESNNDDIAYALRLAFATLAQDKQTLEGITVNGVEDIEASSADKGYIHFRVVGKENNKVVKIGVSVLQQSGGRYQGAALKRLTNYKKFDITRGCLVRSNKINSGAGAAQNLVKQLLEEQGGEWVKLQEQDIKPLLAILFVYDNCESNELSEEEILDFIKQNKLAIDNPLVREILSDPSGQEPDNLTDEDLPMRVPMSVDDSDSGIEWT